jgi:hypothetical protein
MNDLVLMDLQTDISVGNITTNAAMLLEAVKHGVEKYHDPDYVPTEAAAKADRAELNRAEKAVADKVRQVKDRWNAPLETFNEIVSEIRSTIKDASGVVDNAVKTYEEKQKSKKKQEIEDYFATKNFDLVPLEKIFDQKWLNKTAKMKDIREEIDTAISAIYRDIEILEKIPDHGMAAKAFYLEEMDMWGAFRQVEILKENAERLAREQLAREERKMQEQCGRNASAERQERREELKEEVVQNMVDQAVGLPVGTSAAQERDEIIEYTMTFKGTREKLFKLREYMTANGIPYNKGLLLENEDDARLVMRERNIAGRVYSFIYVPAA